MQECCGTVDLIDGKLEGVHHILTKQEIMVEKLYFDLVLPLALLYTME